MELNWLKALELLNGALPLYERMNKDQKQVDAFYADWKDAIANAQGDNAKLATLYGIPAAMMMKAPRKFSFNFDPFKPCRLLSDDFARALDFKRYKALRGL